MALDLLFFPEPCDPVDAVLIGLHGRDANKHAFFPLVRQLSFLRTQWVLPSAPFLSGPSPDVHRWFSPSDSRDVERLHSRGELFAVIDAQLARGVKAENVFLVGFSQGAVMSLDAGLRYPRRLGGIVALSGYLADPISLRDEGHPANARIPIFVGHGKSDDVVPYSTGEDTAEALWEMGYSVEFRGYDAAHRISSEEVKDIRAFLHRHLFGLSAEAADEAARFVVPF